MRRNSDAAICYIHKTVRHLNPAWKTLLYLLQNSRNVLVASSAAVECGMVAKLADLGLSRAIKQHKTHRTTNTIGTQPGMNGCGCRRAPSVVPVLCAEVLST
jgi:hypothetical protein